MDSPKHAPHHLLRPLRGCGLLALVALMAPASPAQTTAAHPLGQTFAGSPTLRASLSASGSAIAVAVADFNADGAPDLVTGFALGSAGAVTLQPGDLASPGFLPQAATFALPVRPDLLQAADLDGDGAVDLLVAGRGDTAVYLLKGDGLGHFASPRSIAIGGRVTALTTLSRQDGSSLLVAGVCAAGCSLRVLDSSGQLLASLPLKAAATSLEAASLNRGILADLVAVAGGRVLLVDGDSLLTAAPQVEVLPIAGATATAAGDYVYDHRGIRQLAVLTGNGTLHVLARTGVDSHSVNFAEVAANRRAARGQHPPTRLNGTPWTLAETLQGATNGAANPILLRGRFSGSGGDDLLILAGGQTTRIAHPQTVGDTTQTTANLTVEAGTATLNAVVPARLATDGRLGLVATDGSLHPLVTLPTTNKTFNVNTTTDALDSLATSGRCTTNSALQCTLRDAVGLANADSAANGTTKIDNINLPAGTYTLSYNAGTDSQGSAGYHMDLDAPVNILGAGAASTIIDANSLDKIFSVNSGVVNAYHAFDVFLSGVTLRNGVNPNASSGNYFGGLIDWESNGTGYLTLNNCVLTNGFAKWGPGGAIGASDTPGGSGTLEVDNTTLSSNRTPEGGGAIYAGYKVPVILTADSFTSNQSKTSLNTADTSGYGQGGAIWLDNNPSGTQSTITGGAVTGNSSSDAGGGIYSLTGFAVTGLSITGNTATSYGGGLFFNTFSETGSVTTSTFTGNTSSADGGGIFVGSSTTANTLNLHYNRIVGNVNLAHSGIGVGVGSTGGTVNATTNWWGCNGAATGTGCDAGGATAGSLALTPYTKLTLTLSATSLTAGQTLTATGDLAHDSTGAAIAAANVAAYTGVAATAKIVQADSSITTNTGTLAASTASIADAQVVNVAGNGTASTTVDGTTVSAAFAVVGPPTFIAAFSPTSVPVGGTSTLTFTVTNPNTSAVTGLAFSDTLPSGLTVATPNGATNACAGTLTATAGTGSITFSGGSVAASSNCKITVNITPTAAASYTDTTTAISTTNAGTGSTASANLTAIAPPTLAAAFGASTIALNTTTSLTFNLTNPNTASSLSSVAFTDNLPSGLIVSTPNGLTGSCGGGTISAVAGGSTISLSGANLAASATCGFAVTVKGTTSGLKSDITTAVTSTEGGTGSTASASITVALPASRLVFGSAPPASITAGTGAGTITVLEEDSSNNVTTTASDSITLTVTGAGYSQAYTVTASSGVATFNLSSPALTAAGAYTYTATATGLTQAQATETVSPAAPASLRATGLPTPTQNGSAASLTVTALDSFGNTVTSFTGTVSITSADTTANLPAAYTYTAGDNGVHVFNVTLNTAGIQSVTANSGGLTGSQTVLVLDSVWIVNANGTVARLTDAGVPNFSAGPAGSTATYAAIAFDNAGNAWAVDNTASSVLKVSRTGTVLSGSGFTGGGLNLPTALAIDGNGQVWTVNGNNSVSVLSPSGAAITPATGYQGGAISTPTGIAIDSSGSVWIANSGNNSVTKIIGGAAPVLTPTVAATINNTLGSKP